MKKNGKNFSAFLKNALFKDISDSENLQKLYYSAAEEIVLQQGDTLINEGGKIRNLYFILSGTLEVLRYDKKYQAEHSLATLSAGEVIGEIALIDNGSSSSWVRSKTLVHMISIPFAQFNSVMQQNPRLYVSLLKSFANRLRHSNELALTNFQKQLDEYRVRVMMSAFLISTISLFSFFILALSGLTYFQQKFTFYSSFITIFILIIISSIFFPTIIKMTRLPLSFFGITTRNWKKSIIESVFYTLPFFVLLVLIKWIVLKTVSGFDQYPLFTILSPSNLFFRSDKVTWVMLVLFYSFIIVPLQELIARGGLQNSLQIFLTNKHKLLLSILISNLIFSSFHVYLSVPLALLVFFPGIFWGWLYSRHHTLIGVWISHMLLGVWAFFLVGI